LYSRHVRDFYSNTCLLSGKTSNQEVLEVHHLNPVKKHAPPAFRRQSQKLVLYNGVVLTKTLHRRFHKIYGIECSLDQFPTLRYFIFYSEA
jgi:hypothetical protein